PFGRRAFLRARWWPHAHDDRTILDAQRFGAGHDMNAAALRCGQLHAVRPLLGGIGAPEVAEARAPATTHVQRKLFSVVAGSLAAENEQPIVVVDLVRLEQMDAILRHVSSRPLRYVG